MDADCARLPGILTNISAGRRARGLEPVFRSLCRVRRPISSGASPADRHLREAGVTYRAPGETADRLWLLSHLPLIIDEADWLHPPASRSAQLLEMVLRDSMAMAGCRRWCPPPPSPAATNICGRFAASNRRAGAT
jgi:hypothetical protein